MILTFLPVRMDDRLTVERRGDVLTLNGEAFDFTPLPDGAILPPEATGSPWFTGPVRREGGVLHIGLLLPHGATAPEATRFPVPLTLDADGPVALPPHSAENADED